MNLLEMAKLTSASKFINRQEALARTGVQVSATDKAQLEQQNIMAKATLGGMIGKVAIKNKLPISKEELVREKQKKDKVALQENSLAAFAMSSHPGIYAPCALPFINKPEAAPGVQTELRKSESVSSAQLDREQSSNIKLQRLESVSHKDNQVIDLLLGNQDAKLGSVVTRISELEPFIMQLPSTLPLSTDKNDLNSLMDQISLTSKEPEQAPLPFGKILVMKSGKVVLRVQSSEQGHIDYILNKGIAPNFYQELVSAHPIR